MTPSSASDTTSGHVSDGPSSPRGMLGKRRTFLINKRYQLKASMLTATVVLVLLVFINLLLYSSTVATSAEIMAEAPEFAKMIEAQDRAQFYLILLASGVFLAGVFLVSVLETHKTAGAAYNLGRRLRELRDGNYRTSLTLRKGDHLVELEAGFNGLARMLRGRAQENAEALEALAESASRGASGTELSAKLQELAAKERSYFD